MAARMVRTFIVVSSFRWTNDQAGAAMRAATRGAGVGVQQTFLGRLASESKAAVLCLHRSDTEIMKLPSAAPDLRRCRRRKKTARRRFGTLETSTPNQKLVRGYAASGRRQS